MGKRFRNGVFVATVLAAFVPVLHAVLPAQAASPTVVALTFDDGWANQAAAVPLLDAHNMKATFYVNSGVIDQPTWLTWAQLTQFQTDGQEIGGNTLNHVDINSTTTPVSIPDATTQVCEDRARLIKHGLTVTDFSYPFGDPYQNANQLAVLTGCGYNSARNQWGLYDTNTAADHCPAGDGCGYPMASPVPPTDAYSIPTAHNVDDTTTLAELEGYVTRAQAGGGLVPFVFHQICDNDCDQYSTSTTIFNQFLDFLANSGVTVQTMHQVIPGTVAASPGTADVTAPTTAISCDVGGCASTVNATPVTVTLTGTDEVGGSGLDAVRYTEDGTTPTTSSPAYTAPIVLTATTTLKYASWDNAGNVEPTNTQTIGVLDTTAPVSTITCNGGPCGTGAFNANVSVALAATDNSHTPITIRYTTDGTTPTATPAHGTVYTVPFTVPLSGGNKTVKYRAFDSSGNAEATNSQPFTFETIAPISAMLCNGGPCSTAWSNVPVQVSLSGADAGGSGLAAIRFTTDGSAPSPASPAYTAPFTVSSPTTVQWRAYDNASNAEGVHSQVLQIDTVAPGTTARCNNGACTNAWHHAATLVTLAATDGGGSGLASIRYTLNGSTPTAASAAYSAPIPITATKTVTFRAFDNAGNAGAPKSIVVRVDMVKPTVSVKSPAVQAQSAGVFRFTANASDKQSKIVRVNFYIDQRFKHGDTKAPFDFAWNPAKAKKGVHTLTVKAIDVAGNIGVKVIKFKVR